MYMKVIHAAVKEDEKQIFKEQQLILKARRTMVILDHNFLQVGESEVPVSAVIYIN